MSTGDLVLSDVSPCTATFFHIPNGVIVTNRGSFSARFPKITAVVMVKLVQLTMAAMEMDVGVLAKRSSVNPAKGIYCLNRCKIWN